MEIGINQEEVAKSTELPLPRHDFLIIPNFSARSDDDTSYASLRRASSDELEVMGGSLREKIEKDAETLGTSLTEEQQETAEHLFDDMEDWSSSQLGLNLKNRRPSLATFRRVTNGDPGYDPSLKWGYVTREHITAIPQLSDTPDELPEEIDPNNLELRNMSHEIVHGYGSQIWMVPDPEEKSKGIVSKFGQGRTIAYGFTVERAQTEEGKRERSLLSINEAVTEMINLELLNQLKIKQGVDLIDDQPISYQGEVIMFDMLFNNMAEKLNLTHEDMRKEVYQKYFKGRASITRLLAKAFGHEAANIVAELDEESANFVNLAVDMISSSVPENASYDHLIRLMELTGIDPKEYKDKFVNVYLRKGLEITGASGKISSNPTVM